MTVTNTSRNEYRVRVGRYHTGYFGMWDYFLGTGRHSLFERGEHIRYDFPGRDNSESSKEGSDDLSNTVTGDTGTLLEIHPGTGEIGSASDEDLWEIEVPKGSHSEIKCGIRRPGSIGAFCELVYTTKHHYVVEVWGAGHEAVGLIGGSLAKPFVKIVDAEGEEVPDQQFSVRGDHVRQVRFSIDDPYGPYYAVVSSKDADNTGSYTVIFRD